MGGLRPELAAEARVHRPKSYTEAIDIARLQEDHLSAAKKAGTQVSRRIGGVNSEVKGGGIGSTGGQQGIVGRPIPSGVRRLPWDELQKRREKGLCFNCDEKFTPGHKCKGRQAFLIEPMESSEEEIETPVEGDDMEVSVHALVGVDGPRTMRLGSWIHNRRVIAMVDSGFTHNFVNPRVAGKLNLATTAVESFQVKVANESA